MQSVPAELGGQRSRRVEIKDRMMALTPDIEQRAIAFIRTIANRCSACLRRNEENCRTCASSWANSIMRDIDAMPKVDVDYSLYARMEAITRSLKKAKRPLLSSEIEIGDICTRQLKRWTLMKMLRRGLVERHVDMEYPSRFRYQLTPKRKGTNKQ